MTTTEAAKRLKIGRSTVTAWIREGVLIAKITPTGYEVDDESVKRVNRLSKKKRPQTFTVRRYALPRRGAKPHRPTKNERSTGR